MPSCHAQPKGQTTTQQKSKAKWTSFISSGWNIINAGLYSHNSINNKKEAIFVIIKYKHTT